MNLDEYQQLAKRTLPADMPARDKISMLCMGLSGEVGELIEIFKKHLYHKHPMDATTRLEVAHELGDVLWYLSCLAYEEGYDMSFIASENISKLIHRYPSGFSPEASMSRSK